jgi:hypothetical protein
MESGDYMVNAEGVVWVRLPNGIGPSLLTGWSVEEHEDGTITTSPSILSKGPVTFGGAEYAEWHGYLEHGVWREV